MKRDDAEDLVHAAQAGERFASPTAASILASAPDGLDGLTDPKHQILQLIARGTSSAAIAEELGTSPKKSSITAPT